MIVDIIMPKMGESITEGTILEWRKKVGEYVKKDEILLEIGTDKVDSEIPSSCSGNLTAILAKPNDVKEIGEVIAKIETDQKNISNNSDKVEENIDNPISEQVEEIPLINIINKKPEIKPKRFYTPIVMKIAAEHNLPLNDLEKIKGTGRGDRVTKKDLLLYLENKTTSEIDLKVDNKPSKKLATGHMEEMSHMRKLIGEHMKQSLSESAHVYVMIEADMTDIVNFVMKKERSFKDNERFNLTYTPFILDAVIKSLKDFPEMNSTISGTLVNYHREINIGLAVAVKNGLMVPCISNCEEKNFLGLCRAVNNIVSKTRNGSITADELSGSTFTITNFGVFGVSVGTPIINQPNVGILGVGAIKKQPVVVESKIGDAIAIRSMMMLSLGFDHRLIDGAGGAQFINKIKYYLETMSLDTVL